MIYYSHVNEDNTIERNLLIQHEASTIFCITGSGERLIALLDVPSVRKVFAVDKNPEANYLLELKLAALRALDIDEYLKFIGYYESSMDRAKVFADVNNKLSPNTAEYWRTRKNIIRKGILNAGYFERYLSKLRPKTKIFLGKTFKEYCNLPKITKKAFPSLRWQMLLKLLSHQYFYKVTGNKDFAFIGPGCDHKVISNGLDKTLSQRTTDSNFMFQLVFNGHLHRMKPADLPPSLLPENLKTIRKRLLNGELEIEVIHGDLAKLIKTLPEYLPINTFHSYSDILSFEDLHYLKGITSHLKRSFDTQTHIVFRSFLRNNYPKNELEQILESPILELTSKEKTNMYKVFYMMI